MHHLNITLNFEMSVNNSAKRTKIVVMANQGNYITE